MKDVVIVGGGLAGLTAAFELGKSSLDFHLLETTGRVGGVIETINVGDYLIETGPHAFNSLSQEIVDLVSELGLKNDLLEGPASSKKRYIYDGSKLISVPMSLAELIKTTVLSKEGKLTLLEEFFIRKEDKEESVEEFISRRFGREVLKNVIQPFINGVFAGDVKNLSANAVFPKLKDFELKYKSVFLGFLLSSGFKRPFRKISLYSLKNGLEMLTKELYKKLSQKVTLNAKDIEITRAKDFFIVNFKINNKTITYTTNSVLFATPAYKVLQYSHLFPYESLLENFQIEYVPVATINQVVESSRIGVELDGFGFLCVKEPHRKLLGTIWTSSVFPKRATENKTLLTSYVGGAYYKKIVNQTDEEIKNIVTKEVSEILKIQDPNCVDTIHMKLNHSAIPQYNLGHTKRVKEIEQFMDKNYGLFFTGNYLYGISMNDTVKTSKNITNKIKNFLEKQKNKRVLEPKSLTPA